MKSQAEEPRGPPVQGERGGLPRRLHGRAVREGQGRRPGHLEVGGQKIPPVDAYIAGFQQGAKDANPDIETLNGYSEDFVDQAKCKELALNQIAQGSQVVFQVAGQCGLGALDAAKEKGLQGIGVDADQGYLGDHVMTSALKNIDEAVFTTVQEIQDGTFMAAADTIFDVKSGGVGFGKLNAEGEKYLPQVEEQEEKIKTARSRTSRLRCRRPDHRQSTQLALELQGVTKRFGALTANDSVDFDLRRGEVHALLGENGAGKSTLMNVLYGLLQPDEGEVILRGEPVRIGSPREAIACGIGMVHQHFMLIPVMTVAENVVLAGEPPRARCRPQRRRGARARASGRFGLAVDPRALVEDLCVGEQQRVEILRVLHRARTS